MEIHDIKTQHFWLTNLSNNFKEMVDFDGHFFKVDGQIGQSKNIAF